MGEVIKMFFLSTRVLHNKYLLEVCYYKSHRDLMTCLGIYNIFLLLSPFVYFNTRPFALESSKYL